MSGIGNFYFVDTIVNIAFPNGTNLYIKKPIYINEVI